MDDIELDSDSAGDPTRFVALAELERGLAALPPPPREEGSVVFIVRRQTGMNGRREILNEAEFSPELGVHGDRWESHKESRPDAQVAAVQVDVANLIANRQSLALFGDSLFLSIDRPGARHQTKRGWKSHVIVYEPERMTIFSRRYANPPLTTLGDSAYTIND